MNISGIANIAQKALRDNSPTILTALGVSGTLGTAYLTGVASYKAAMRLSEERPDLTKREILEIVWDLYVPAAISGMVTIGCIVGSNRVSAGRITAAYSVAAVTEKAFAEYKDKVIEQHGVNKEQKIRDELAQDRINANPPPNSIVVGTGQVMCCELHTGRYFECDMERLRKAQNDLNAKLVSGHYATLSDFYYFLDLPMTSESSRVGWEPEKQLVLEFSTCMSNNNVPCIAFDYNYIKTL